jgi:hypothetical protein
VNRVFECVQALLSKAPITRVGRIILRARHP